MSTIYLVVADPYEGHYLIIDVAKTREKAEARAAEYGYSAEVMERETID